MDKKDKNKKDVIDLTKFITPESIDFDPDGSYTGMPKENFFGDDYVEPIQDADDL